MVLLCIVVHAEENLAAAQFAEQLSSLREDRTIFWGEGISVAGADLGQAKIDAKRRALADLSEKIQVRVESDITTILDATRTKVLRDDLRERVRTYTDVALSGVQERYMLDVPRKGSLTYFVYLPKDEYAAKVQQDMALKRRAVQQAILSGDDALSRMEIARAITAFAAAGGSCESYFGRLPVNVDLAGTGREQIVSAVVEDRLALCFSRIFIEQEKGSDARYTASGSILSLPRIICSYTDSAGGRHILPDMPLFASMTLGSGELVSEMKSGPAGSPVHIMRLDPSFARSAVTVAVDTSKYSGVSALYRGPIPSAIVPFERQRTVVLSLSGCGYLKDEISSVLASRGFASISAGVKDSPASNAEYLFKIQAGSTEPRQVGDLKNMFVSDASGSVLLIQLPDNVTVAQENVSAARGYGVTASAARTDALSKIHNRLLETTRNVITALR